MGLSKEKRKRIGDDPSVLAESFVGRAFPEIKPLSFLEFRIFP
jgi:hypothetical protein